MFTGFTSNPWETDAGHFAHSKLVMSQAFSKLGFWGVGYGDKPGIIEVERGVRGVHNAYVAVWMWHGAFAIIYYLSMIAIFIGEIFKTIKNHKIWDPAFILIRSSVLLFFTSFLISIYYLSVNHLIDIREIVCRTIIFALLFRVKPYNYKILFNKNKNYALAKRNAPLN